MCMLCVNLLPTNLLVAPEGFRYSGNGVPVCPTDAREPVPLRDPPVKRSESSRYRAAGPAWDNYQLALRLTVWLRDTVWARLGVTPGTRPL